MIERKEAWDRIDRQILHCLCLSGRASFRVIGDVIGTSEQTVARRYRRLFDRGVVRVLVQPALSAAGQWSMVRVQAQPSHTRGLATALANRVDVSWVSLLSSGSEIVCTLMSPSLAAHNELVLEGLPGTGRVVSLSVASLIHIFRDPDRADWDGFDDGLDDRQRHHILATRPEVRVGASTLREEDRDLVDVFAQDARMSYAALAERTGMPERQVARRIETLLQGGALFLDVDISAVQLGFPVTALLFLQVDLGKLHETGMTIVRQPRTTFVAAVTGQANLVASVACRDGDDLYRYLTEVIGRIPAIRSVESAMVLERVKFARSMVGGARLLPYH